MQLWEMVLIRASNLSFQLLCWALLRSLPSYPSAQNNTRQSFSTQLQIPEQPCGCLCFTWKHARYAEQRAAVKPAVLGKLHATANLWHFALMLLKNSFPGRWRNVTCLPSPWPGGWMGQAVFFLILYVLPRWILGSLAAQALTFRKYFSSSKYC